MEDFVKTEGENSIEYILYDEPVELIDIYEQFPEGGVIIYHNYINFKNKKESKYVDLYIKYKEGIADIDYYWKIFREAYNPDDLFRFRENKGKFVIPTNIENMIWRKPLIVSKKYFYKNSFLKDYGEKISDRIDEWTNIRMYIAQDDVIGIIKIYGLSYDKKENNCFKELKEFVAEEVSYSWYLDNKELYLYGDFTDYDEDEESHGGILNKISNWLKRTDFTVFCNVITAKVRGQENLKIILANVYNYLECLVWGEKHNNNTLLAAPSGCGKTETYRVLKEYFKKHIPGLIVYQYDMTALTEEGYNGHNRKDMLEPLVMDEEDSGIGIVFLDEFDKKIMPSFSEGGVNVNALVQAQILTIIEGSEVIIRNKKVDTNKTMFIGMGSFDSCRKKRNDKKRKIGFKSDLENNSHHYDEIRREDIIELGASYELLGRFSSIVNYHELDEENINMIIDDICKSEGEQLKCEIKVTDDMRKYLYENANSKFGCRLLRSIIHSNAMEEYINVLKGGARRNMVLDCWEEEYDTNVNQPRCNRYGG